MKSSPLFFLGLIALAQSCGGSGGPSKVNRDIVLGAFYDTASSGTFDPQLVRNLPQEVDLSADLTPVKDQSNRGTCTFFSSIALAEATIKKDQKREVNLSEEYLVAVTKKDDDEDEIEYEFEDLGYSEGSFSDFNIDMLIERGALLESDWPYRPSSFDRGFPCEKYASRKLEAPGSCFFVLPPEAHVLARRVDGKNFEKIKLPSNTNELIRFLALERRPVIVALPVNHNGWGRDGVIRHDENLHRQCLNRPEDCGRHEVLIYGYDLSRKVFLIKNSWGKSWGKNGFGEIDIAAVDKYADMDELISLKLRSPLQIPQDLAAQEASVQSFNVKARETSDGAIEVALQGQVQNTRWQVLFVSSGLARITSPETPQLSNTEMIKLTSEEDHFGDPFVRVKLYENIDGVKDAISWNGPAATISSNLVKTTTAQVALSSERSMITMRTVLAVHTDTERFKLLRLVFHPLEKAAP